MQTPLGVIYAPFQVPEIPPLHDATIGRVMKAHVRVAIVLPVKRFAGTSVSPLDFATRQRMIQSAYPDLTVLPLPDQKYVKDRVRALEMAVSCLTHPTPKTTIYAPIEFINTYRNNGGRWETSALSSFLEVEANFRQGVQHRATNTYDFRCGALYALQNQYPATIPTVDIAITRTTDTGIELLLGRKPNENNFRFIGGYKDRSDDGYEDTGRREGKEEANAKEFGPLRYLGSRNVTDWRYEGERDGITTILFEADLLSGEVEAGDDIVEVKWFPISVLSPDMVEGEHSHLMAMFLKAHAPEVSPTAA